MTPATLNDSLVSFTGNFTSHPIPPMPEIGHPEGWYAKRIAHAEEVGDELLREAMKVGQYVTLGLDPEAAWEDKLKYFKHALRRHCKAPDFCDDPKVLEFFEKLANLVREYCGTEALRLASKEDDMFDARRAMGQSREQIEDDAEDFFGRIVGSGSECPPWFNESEWVQLRLLRDAWI